MKSKQFTNKGIPRTIIEVKTVRNLHPFDGTEEENKMYLFEGLGYLNLYFGYEGRPHKQEHYGFITPERLKELLGERQWTKFCEGKREFILQRRVDGKNVKKTSELNQKQTSKP